MAWVWQLAEWPNFVFDPAKLHAAELEFHHKAGEIAGALKHLAADEDRIFAVELLSQEAVSTSSIEGEILNRDSVKSSIRKQLGLKADTKSAKPNEIGVSEMMVDVYTHYQHSLSHDTLFMWHAMLMNGRRDLEVIGAYRQHSEPMQIVSGNYNAPKVFYEAPPSAQVAFEMDRFLQWYQSNLGSDQVPTLAFAGIVHLYFEMIHPFEDGNGRIGRALVEKAISQRLGTPALHSLAKVIDASKKTYYQALQACNSKLSIDDFLAFFAKTSLDAQEYTIQLINFTIAKVHFFAKHTQHLNERQMKVLLRMFEEGIEGFKGGLSAKNYQSIVQTSPATATRDLLELVGRRALLRTGELKGTRYFLGL
jgi:Fic family protein